MQTYEICFAGLIIVGLIFYYLTLRSIAKDWHKTEQETE
jgi:hypothetical protein